MPNKTPKKPTNWSKVSKQLSFWVFVILVPVAIIQFSGKGSDAAPEIPYTPQYDQELQKNNIDKVTIQAGRLLTGEFKSKVPVRIRNGEVVPYIKRPMGLHKPGNIVEIVIGPAAPVGAEDGVRTLLDKYKINAKIRRSKIPYRPV